MPYITRDRRAAIDPRVYAKDCYPLTAGELNYAITMLMKAYWQNHNRSYQTINDIVGAVEGAKAEFQRRVVVPYENDKIETNGDVYT